MYYEMSIRFIVRKGNVCQKSHLPSLSHEVGFSFVKESMRLMWFVRHRNAMSIARSDQT
jgi:hypothetical protein